MDGGACQHGSDGVRRRNAHLLAFEIRCSFGRRIRAHQKMGTVLGKALGQGHELVAVHRQALEGDVGRVNVSQVVAGSAERVGNGLVIRDSDDRDLLPKQFAQVVRDGFVFMLNVSIGHSVSGALVDGQHDGVGSRRCDGAEQQGGGGEKYGEKLAAHGAGPGGMSTRTDRLNIQSNIVYV